MSLEIQSFAVVIPAGTAKATPGQFPLAMPARQINRIEVEVPPGPRGEVGFQLGTSGSQIIPITPGAFVVADGRELTWDLDGQMDSGAWQMIAYNTGKFNHTLQVRFLVSLVPSQLPPAGFQPLPTGAISG